VLPEYMNRFHFGKNKTAVLYLSTAVEIS